MGNQIDAAIETRSELRNRRLFTRGRCLTLAANGLSFMVFA
jgi:hypothetical protein